MSSVNGAQRQLLAAGPAARRSVRRLASERVGEKGFVKRFEGFDQVLAKANSFRGTHHTKIVILAAVRTMPGLTPAERQVLAEAVDIIRREAFASPEAGIVYPRNHAMADRCSLSLERVKVARRGLERKGLAIRHIAGDNNSSRLDIRPFLADIDQHIAYRVGLDETRHEADQADNGFSTIERIENIPQGVDSDTHIQSFRTASGPSVPADAGKMDSTAKAAEESIREDDASRSRSSGRRQGAGANCSAGGNPQAPKRAGVGKCSPGGASVSARANSAPPEGPKQPLEQLLAAYELSPRWRDVVDIADVQQLAYDRLFAATAEMVRKHFPDPKRNHNKTFAWAVDKHGWRAILMAIIAIEDPNVQSPGAYLGKLVNAGDRMDLSLNLGWIAAHRKRQAEQLDEQSDELREISDDRTVETGDVEGQYGDDQVEQQAKAPIGGKVEGGPGRDDRPEFDLIRHWPLFLQALASVLHKGEFGRWKLGDDLKPEGVSGSGDLIVSMPHSLSAEWIQQHYSHQLRLATERMRWRFKAVKVRARS